MPLWGHKKSEAESGRQHGAEARSIPRWLATDPFSGVAELLNWWAAPVLLEALDEKVTPLLVENAVESVKLRGAKLELKAAGQVGWLFLSALHKVYRKTLTQDAEIIKLRDEVAALQERQLLMKETIESAVTRGDQMETRCTALAREERPTPTLDRAAERRGRRPGPRGGPLSGGILSSAPEGLRAWRARSRPREQWDRDRGSDPKIHDRFGSGGHPRMRDTSGVEFGGPRTGAHVRGRLEDFGPV
ncbi:hypothetical protein NDU88_007243 [Pleurodeles waltl]|uniref:Uncharacterized protein n=1 Tax=Pleurodeles waltl TaxID=8319 RepID=A0AAV7NW67_PLEWA|nr:hypothetical protein NDU88_007243 [Pleurodeles waltl]